MIEIYLKMVKYFSYPWVTINHCLKSQCLVEIKADAIIISHFFILWFRILCEMFIFYIIFKIARRILIDLRLHMASQGIDGSLLIGNLIQL